MAGELFISGLTGTGFDGGAIVDQLLQIRALPIQKLQREKALIQAKVSSVANLSQAIGDFYSLFEGLEVESLFKGKQASVSDPDVLSVSVTEEAPNLEFNVNVNKLAQAEVRISNGGFLNLTDTFAGSGTLTITYDTGAGAESFNIDYNAGQTLEDLVNSINSAQDRVRASVYYDGTAYKLMLSESDVSASTVETDTAGGIYAISVSGLPSELGTGLDTIQSAQNAEIVIGSGSPVTSPSNAFENVMSGVTIEAKATGSSSVTITESYTRVKSFFNDFVSKYNALVDTVGFLTQGDGAIFRGDYTIGSVQIGIAQRLDPLIELGLIDYNGDTGKISLSTERLDELLNTDPDKVRALVEDIKNSYGSYLQSQQELFSGFEQSYNDQIENIDKRIEELSVRLKQEEIILRREYAQLEAFISQANEIRDRLKQFIVSISEMTKGGSNS